MKEYYEDIRFEDDILHVRLSGEFPEELFHEAHNLFQPLIDACKTHQCRKALVDARKLEVHFGTAELFRSGEDAASLTGEGLRIAFLAGKDMLSPFFDDVVYNRGGKIGVFTDIKKARAWLHKQPE